MARLVVLLWVIVAAVAYGAVVATESTDDAATRPDAALDPADWGSDHVGEPVPEFVESGECLFCHRHEVGASWAKNRHQTTIHDASPTAPAMEALQDSKAADVADEVELLLGDGHAHRFLRRSQDYGKLDLLSVIATSRRGRRFRIEHADNPHWDREKFAQQCAGCHATGVDPESGAFALPSLDCFVCHGDGPLEHSNDAKLMPLAETREDPPRVVISICAQCHLRGGRSKATGRPYPTNFVAGDNLFRDFEFDFDLADDPTVNPGDRHVIDNVRQVVIEGRTDMTCLSCHDVHIQSSRRHRDLKDEHYCTHCHEAGKPKREFIRYEVHSDVCEY